MFSAHMLKRALFLPLLCLMLAGPGVTPPVQAGGDPSIVWDGSEMPQGVLFYWYEPSFYTGFAPRTQDPSRAPYPAVAW